MIKGFFYLGAIVFMIYELSWILTPLTRVKSKIKYDVLSKEFKNKKWDDYSDEYKGMLKSKLLFHLPMILWMFLGLFTYNWGLFACFLFFEIFITSPLSRLFKYNYVYTFIHWVNSVIGFCFSLLVLINAYHLHIDFSGIIVSFIESFF